ncbi:MAG: LytTR family DNA-binding domain-containing protein [Rhodoferax sp.]|nr:LytTR family DNA-binding domain-containing protein [Rhodoferax sp.]MDP3650639.1 LytTR family DNA-binding domain-containing protein [Rhodoferax sp.]
MTNSLAHSVLLRALVVDDESLARLRMRTLLADCTAPRVSLEAEASNAVQAMEQLQRQRIDVALVDIHMPGADGMALARSLQSLAHPPALIFVTAHAEHAVQAFELEAVDYLTKPVRLERLQAALQKVERFLQAQTGGPSATESEDVLIIQERGRTERVPLHQVVYFKAELKYVTVRTAARSYILDGSLNELEEKYGDRYMRIHRNALIARRSVQALEKHYDAEEGEGWAVRLHGVEELLAVSRRQLAAVRELVLR